MDVRAHWEKVYQTKAPTQVSWYQPHAVVSLGLIRATGAAHDDPMIDIGGGASALIGDLLTEGYTAVSVLDISATALRAARERLGECADRVNWIEADVTETDLPREHFVVWHDRAVFHFLTEPAARRRYVDMVRSSVKPGGHVIVASFASDGPEMCSGLNVCRYEPETMHREFGDAFTLLSSTRETHQTPWGAEQKFVYCYCRKADSGARLAESR